MHFRGLSARFPVPSSLHASIVLYRFGASHLVSSVVIMVDRVVGRVGGI